MKGDSWLNFFFYLLLGDWSVGEYRRLLRVLALKREFLLKFMKNSRHFEKHKNIEISLKTSWNSSFSIHFHWKKQFSSHTFLLSAFKSPICRIQSVNVKISSISNVCHSNKHFKVFAHHFFFFSNPQQTLNLAQIHFHQAPVGNPVNVSTIYTTIMSVTHTHTTVACEQIEITQRSKNKTSNGQSKTYDADAYA